MSDNATLLLSPPPAIPKEEMMQTPLPEGYWLDIVADGYERWDIDSKSNKTYVNKLHIVKPNGKTACGCHINPTTTFNYPHVRAPLDFYDLFCDESMNYLCAEMARLRQQHNNQPSS